MIGVVWGLQVGRKFGAGMHLPPVADQNPNETSFRIQQPLEASSVAQGLLLRRETETLVSGIGVAVI